jgi:hypothetical protein
MPTSAFNTIVSDVFWEKNTGIYKEKTLELFSFLYRSSSCLLSKKRCGKDRDPPSLPSLGALVWGGREVMPSVNPTSPLAFLQALAHFLASVCSVHRGIHLQVSSA